MFVSYPCVLGHENRPTYELHVQLHTLQMKRLSGLTVVWFSRWNYYILTHCVIGVSVCMSHLVVCGVRTAE